MRFLSVNFGNFYGRIKYSSAVSVLVDMYCSFSLLAQRKRTKRKGTPAAWSFGLPCAPRSCRKFTNSLRSNSVNFLGGSFSGAQQTATGGAKKPPGGAFTIKNLRYSSVYLLMFITLAGCAPQKPVYLPELTATGNEAGHNACATVFPQGRFQFVHSIEFAMADDPVSTVIGVTSLANDEISCALMTVEGLTLFAAVFKTGLEPEVRRAIPPFDRAGFAVGLMQDVRTIFVPPPAEHVRYGSLADKSPVCRSTAADGQVTDIMPAGNGCWRITTYTAERVIDRSVVARSCRKNGGALIPEYLELTGFGREKYTLKMKLITAEELGQLP
jgi:hypothetical protein